MPSGPGALGVIPLSDLHASAQDITGGQGRALTVCIEYVQFIWEACRHYLSSAVLSFIVSPVCQFEVVPFGS